MTMRRTHAGHGSIWPAETSGKPAEARASDQSTLTAERIAELRELLAMATPGRWVACDCAEAEDVDAAEGLAVFPTTEFEQDADAPAAIAYMSENWGEFADNAALIVAAINTLPDLLDAAERLQKVGSGGGMIASTMPTTADLAAANYARKTAERERDDALALASRAREDALREGFLAGFLASGEGFNGEYPFDYDRADIEANEGFAERVRVFINKPKGGDASDKSKERTRDPATSPGVTAGASAGWQPIETAPRDGREILVYDPIVQITFCVRWTGARFPWTLVFGYREFSERSPSHWMPLPAAPVDGGEDAH